MRKFRWLLTPEGGAWPEAGAAAVSVAAAPAPENDASFENDRALLGAVDEWLRTNSDFGFDLALLEQAGILRTPPQWSYLKQALARAGKDKAREIDDRQAIRAYATMLRDRRDELECALMIAGLGRLASNAQIPARQMQDALRALSESLVHGAKPERHIKFEPPKLAGLELPSVLNGFREWAETLSVIPDFPEVERRSWARWLQNFDAWWSRGESTFPYEFEDYLLRVRGSGPPSLLPENLAAISLYQWTRLTAPLTDSPVPEWLKGSAWHALGFDQEARLALDRVAPGESEFSRAWASRLADSQLDGPQEYWLLVVADSGPAMNWLPEKQYPTIAVRRSELLSFPSAPGVARGALVELVGDPEEVNASADKPFPLPPPLASTLSAYFGAVKLPKRPLGATPYLYNPHSVGEAVRKLKALSERREAPRREPKKGATKSDPIEIGDIPEEELVVGDQKWLTLIASKGTPPYGWVVTSGMVPPGMRLVENGVIEGAPSSPGKFQFTVRATDAVGNIGDRMFGVKVYPMKDPSASSPSGTKRI